MRTFATVLAFAASALAYSVTAPTNSSGFVNDGPNTVSWTTVSSDPANFTIVLVNMNVFPNYQQVLDALVVGSQGSISVNPPSEGWPSGSGYQINFVKSATELNSLLAQSNDFSFHAPTSSSGSASGSSTSLSATGLTVSPTVTAQTSAITGSNSNSAGASDSAGASGSQSGLNPSSSDTSTTPNTPNGAASTGVQAAFFGVVALVGALLA